MPTRNQSHPVIYRAFNTLTGFLQSGDVGNHQLAWSKDGVLATPTNAPRAVTGWDGWYYFWTTNAEANCEVGELIGRSTTGSHIHIESRKYFYQLEVALTTAGLAAVRADGLEVNLLTGQTVALTPAYQATLTTAIEAALLNDGDGQSLVDAIITRIESDLDGSDVSVQAIAVAVRNAILDRLLAGNHEAAGSVGAQLLKIDTLMLAADYIDPDNNGITNAAEAATSAAAGVVTLQQRLTTERATLMDNLGDLDATISSRAEPGDEMGLSLNVISSLVESGITLKSPTLADGAIRLFEGNDYLAVIGEAITRTLTQADNNFIAVSCLLVIKKGDVDRLSKAGTVLVPTGLIKVSFDINAAETFAIGRDFFEYYISITNASGLTKTPWFGKTQILASGISNAA